MQRLASEPREDWKATVKNQGLVYVDTTHPDGSIRPYWHEDAYYSFTRDEVQAMEAATRELFEMCIAAGDHVIENELFAKLAIPEWAVEQVIKTWNEEPPSVYGRFDLVYDGSHAPKLLEFNADTPTGLVEGAVIQWNWMEDVLPEADQWNSIHERLIEAWKRQLEPGTVVYFAQSVDEPSGEDYMTVAYMYDLAEQAGLECRGLLMEDIGWHPMVGFCDLEDRPIERIFKLYPWEFMVNEEFGRKSVQFMGEGRGRTVWIEPIYKMLWSNKGLLPVLWELFPDHPNLLPAFFDEPGDMGEWVKKPLFSREGANIELVGGGQRLQTDGMYGSEGFVYQEYIQVPRFNGDGFNYPVLGSWVVDGEPAGLGIRESSGLITDNLSRFLPHAIEG